MIANFRDTSTLWAFLRASLRQCHIHKLSKVGKDKAAWAKADENLTTLNTLALVPTAAARSFSATFRKPFSLFTTCGVTLATTRWIKSTRRGGEEAFLEASLLSCEKFIAAPVRCRNVHDAIDVPSVSKWPPPSERHKLARCKHANQALIQISMTSEMQSMRKMEKQEAHKQG